jgi:hypothetical protein
MLIWFKYYQHTVPHASQPTGSFWWKDVCSLSDIFRGITSCSVKAGDTVLLWKDLWTGEATLQQQLPRLFSYTLLEDVSVAQYMDNSEPATNFALPLSIEAFDELNILSEHIAGLT